MMLSDSKSDGRLPGDGRISIPGYLLPDELRELHERIRIKRGELRQLERAFQEHMRELLQSARFQSGVLPVREID